MLPLTVLVWTTPPSLTPTPLFSKMADNVSNLNLGVHIVRGKDRLSVNIADLIALAKMANPELVKVQEE